MIFWRQSLFDFFEDLLADMLIFITRCSIFFCFFDPPLRPRAGSAAGTTPPIDEGKKAHYLQAS